MLEDTFVNVLKEIFGTNTAVTNSHKIPFTAADGTPAGLASISDLASVLGVFLFGKGGAISHPSPDERFNLNDLRTPGLWTIPSYTTNAPSVFFNTCFVFTTGDVYNGLFQVMFGMDQARYFDPTIFYRRFYNSVWSEWYKIEPTS